MNEPDRDEEFFRAGLQHYVAAMDAVDAFRESLQQLIYSELNESSTRIGFREESRTSMQSGGTNRRWTCITCRGHLAKAGPVALEVGLWWNVQPRGRSAIDVCAYAGLKSERPLNIQDPPVGIVPYASRNALYMLAEVGPSSDFTAELRRVLEACTRLG